MNSSKIVNSIAKGADILRSLSEGIERISDLSNKLHLSKGTTHRLLKSLEMTGLVTQDPVKHLYYLGPLVFELASQPIVAHQNLVVCALQDMRNLRDFTKETVALYVRVGLERICLEELQSFENIRFTVGKGSAAPLYAGSSSKVLLSELEDDELAVLLRNLNPHPIGPNTITNKKLLYKELQRVRSQGYATSFGERVKGGASICLPIKGYICPVALSLLGPENRLSLNVMMRVLEKMKESSKNISRKLKEVIQT